MSQIKRTELADGVFFTAVKDSRFKTMKISANIIAPLSGETASANALLCGVLSRSTAAYPDFTALSKKLSSLYGADLNVSIRKSGDNQVLSISASGLDDRYTLEDESVAKELSLLLCGVLFDPNLSGGAFVSDDVEQERRQHGQGELNERARDRALCKICGVLYLPRLSVFPHYSCLSLHGQRSAST